MKKLNNVLPKTCGEPRQVIKEVIQLNVIEILDFRLPAFMQVPSKTVFLSKSM